MSPPVLTFQTARHRKTRATPRGSSPCADAGSTPRGHAIEGGDEPRMVPKRRPEAPLGGAPFLVVASEGDESCRSSQGGDVFGGTPCHPKEFGK